MIEDTEQYRSASLLEREEGREGEKKEGRKEGRSKGRREDETDSKLDCRVNQKSRVVEIKER